jgi:hypothetical protein
MPAPQSNINPQCLEVGKKLVELCKAGKFEDAVNALYSKDIVSIEVRGDEKMPARQQGIEAIRGKNRWWVENHEIHDAKVEGPWPHGDRFIVKFVMDVTPKSGPFAGKRMKFDEAALYTVKNGKVVQEEFFYHMG